MKPGPVTAGTSKTRTRAWRTVLALFAMVPVHCVFGAGFCSACHHMPSLITVDQALSKAELSAQARSKALELRAQMAGLLSGGNYRDARALEEQIMDIADLKLIPVWGARGCGRWEPKAK